MNSDLIERLQYILKNRGWNRDNQRCLRVPEVVVSEAIAALTPVTDEEVQAHTNRLKQLRWRWQNNDPVNGLIPLAWESIDLIERLYNENAALTSVTDEEVQNIAEHLRDYARADADETGYSESTHVAWKAGDLIERLAREHQDHEAARIAGRETARINCKIIDELKQRIKELEEEVRDLNYMEQGVSKQLRAANKSWYKANQRAERAEQQRDEALAALDVISLTDLNSIHIDPCASARQAAARIRAMGEK